MKTMKKGLVLEGGSMRGMFTAGIIDVFLERGVTFDCTIGVSAGAVFGCNYKSAQHGRSLRYNKKYCRDKRYASFRSLLTTGNFFNEEFCYHTLPNELDPFDVETFKNSPMEFYATCTDVETGEAYYHKCETGGPEDLRYFQASASLPLFARIVEIGDKKYLDGGIADSIPIRKMETLGCDKIVVILTQPKGYEKKKNKYLPLARVALRKYPKMIHAIATRHIRYNRTIRYIESKERTGDIFVMRPPAPLNIGPIEHNPDELDRVYQIGRQTAEKYFSDLQNFLNN